MTNSRSLCPSPVLKKSSSSACAKKRLRQRQYYYKHQVRARLLNRIIAYQEQTQSFFLPQSASHNKLPQHENNSHSNSSTASISDRKKCSPSRKPLGNITCSTNNSSPPMQQRQNNNNSIDQENPTIPKPSSCLRTHKEKENRSSPNRVVRFSQDISRKFIPSRRDYSSSTRELIWTSRHEIKRNAKRNFREFQADGNDWRRATEECNMWVDSVTGELIHPAHISPYAKQRFYYQQQQQMQQQQHQRQQRQQQEHYFSNTENYNSLAQNNGYNYNCNYYCY